MPKAKDVYENLREKLNEKTSNTDSMFDETSGMPKGMEPWPWMGEGWYKSPDTGSFDPRDCSNPRNATSPWCGYNPISTKPIGMGIKHESTDCGNFFTLEATLGFIELPPTYFAAINENCRQKYEEGLKPPGQIQNYQSPNPKQNPSVDFAANETSLPFADDCLYIVELAHNIGDAFYPQWVKGGAISSFEWTQGNQTYRGWHSGGEGHPIYYSSDNLMRFRGVTIMTSYTSGENWIKSAISNIYENAGRTLPDGICYFSNINPADYYTGWGKWNWGNCEKVIGASTIISSTAYTHASGMSRTKAEAYWMESEYGLVCGIAYREINNSTLKTGTWNYAGGFTPDFFMGKGQDIKRYIRESNFRKGGVAYYIRNWKELECKVSPNLSLPPTNPNDCGDEDCMGCCDPKKDKQNHDEVLQLLKKLDKKLGDYPVKVKVWDEDSKKVGYQSKNQNIASVADAIKLENERCNHTQEVLGINEFPVEYPDSLNVPIPNNDIEKFWNWLMPKKTRKMANLPRLIDWFIDQFSATQGQWQQYIEYEEKSGKDGKIVKKKVVLPDAATAIRELFKMSTAALQMNGLETDIQAKIIQNSTNNSLMIAEALKRIKDIQDYLDYVTNERAASYPAQISPGNENASLKEYLQPSNLKYVYDEWMPDKDESLQEQLNDIKQTLVQIRAQIGGE